MGVEFKNNAESTLAGNINGSVTTLALAVGEGNNFPIVTAGPTDYFYCTIVDVSGNREIIKVTEHQSGDTFQVIERGADDTSGQSFVIGDKVQLRLPKIILEAFRDDIVTNAADIATNVSDIATNAAAIAANALLLLAPAGLKMWFYEDSPPSGWTIDAAPADSLLAVKGGAQDYNVTGGQTAGSWTPTTHTHTGPSHVHTMNTHIHTMGSHLHSTGDFTLLETHMPSHTHGIYPVNPSNSTQTGYTGIAGTNQFGPDYTINTQATGGGTAHNHGNTGSTDPGDTNATDPGDTNASGTAATGASSAPSTDRQKAAVGCIGTKD